MKSYANNEKAAYGVYASTHPLDICLVGADGERIAGKAHARYTRLPSWMLLALAPALGGLFVFAFPALVVVALGYATFQLMAKPARQAVTDHAYVAQMRWSPVASHLQHDDGFDGDNDSDDALAEAVRRQRAREN